MQYVLQHRELGTRHCASDVRCSEQRGSKMQQVCFGMPRSRNPTSGATNPAWPRGTGRQERAGLGCALVG